MDYGIIIDNKPSGSMATVWEGTVVLPKKARLDPYNVAPPSYKLVYKPQ